MVEVNWTIASLEDMNSIAEYFELDSAKFASIIIESFFEHTVILETNPYAGKLAIELNDPFIRELIEGNYRIIYRIVNDLQVDILTIHHSSRNIFNNPILKQY